MNATSAMIIFSAQRQTTSSAPWHLFPPGMKAFAPADGEGRNGVYLARMGYDVTSVDVSNLAVDKAHALAAAAGVEIDARVGNMFEYEWPENHFDLIIISFMHFLPEDHDRFISLVRRSIKPGRALDSWKIIPWIRSRLLGGPKNPDMLLTIDRVKADFDGFDFEICREAKTLSRRRSPP